MAIDEDAYSYAEDVAAQLIRFQLLCKPDKVTRALLRRAGFVLHPSRNFYERTAGSGRGASAVFLREHMKRDNPFQSR